MTSAIYLAEPFDPATTLVYDGQVTGYEGTKGLFTATLTGSDGPVEAATLTFTYRDTAYQAVTDAAGRATVRMRFTGPAGPYPLTVTYEGSERYSPSSWTGTFTVTSRGVRSDG
jgi:hypothetical protein